MVIVVNADDEPSFYRIEKCLVVFEDDVHFVCHELQVMHFDCHLHAYAVKHGDKICVINHRSLKWHRPLSIQRMFDRSGEFVSIG